MYLIKALLYILLYFYVGFKNKLCRIKRINYVRLKEYTMSDYGRNGNGRN